MSAFIAVLGLVLLVIAIIRGVGEDARQHGRLAESTANLVAATFVLDATLIFVAAAGQVAPIPLPAVVALPLGLTLLVAGLFSGVAAAHALQSRERLLGIRIDEVISTGPFRYSRHPFYVGAVLAFLGAALLGRSGFALAMVALTALALYALAVREEAFLQDQLGEPYRAFRARTPRLFGRHRAAVG